MSGLEPLHTTAIRAMQDIFAAQPTTPAKVTCAFRLAAGPAMGRAARVHWSEDGTLRIVARDETWRRELKRAKPVIAERLQQFLGRDVIRKFLIEG